MKNSKDKAKNLKKDKKKEKKKVNDNLLVLITLVIICVLMYSIYHLIVNNYIQSKKIEELEEKVSVFEEIEYHNDKVNNEERNNRLKSNYVVEELLEEAEKENMQEYGIRFFENDGFQIHIGNNVKYTGVIEITDNELICNSERIQWELDNIGSRECNISFVFGFENNGESIEKLTLKEIKIFDEIKDIEIKKSKIKENMVFVQKIS